MIKVKHARTADCVVAGFRWYKTGKDAVGSLLLGLYDDQGVLHHVGVTSSFTMAMRKQLVDELAPLRKNAIERASVARLGGCRRGVSEPHARRPEPLERGQGSVVGAAAHRARLRGEVRSPAGRSLSSRRHLFCAGGRTSRRAIAATISSRSRLLTSSRRFSRRGIRGASLRRVIRLIVRIERLLLGTQLPGHVLQIDAHASPGRRAAAHRVDQHVGRREMRHRLADDVLSSARDRRAHPLCAARGRSRSADASRRAGATAARAAAHRRCFLYCGGHGASPRPSRS